MSLQDIAVPFNPHSEEDLKAALVQYFADLGFELGEMSFEDSFRITLGRNAVVVGRTPDPQGQDSLSGRSDMLLCRNGHPLAMVETKRPGVPLTDGDASQALSYARLLREIAPLAIVTNGADTRVYDVVTGDELTGSAGQSSWWRNGQQIAGVSEDIRRLAARTLIGINYQTLMEFCRQQVSMATEDLRGGPYDYKSYVPQVYQQRSAAEAAFRQFLSGSAPCFAVVGESGWGKTNLLCTLADRLLEDRPVLFYWGLRLWDGLTASLRDDFAWEFGRDHHVAHIVERFDELARAHNTAVFVFVDGLDEFPGQLDILKAELIQFVQRIGDSAVRLCVSCKSFDWPRLVLDRGYSLNALGRSCFSPQPVTGPATPDAGANPRDVGFWLEGLEEQELDEAWRKYKLAYGLVGDLRGETRDQCRVPLSLRLLAETYANSGREIPKEMTYSGVFDKDWDRRTGALPPDDRTRGIDILCQSAEMMIVNGTRYVAEQDLLRRLPQGSDPAYHSVLGVGLLQRSPDAQGYPQISFPFEKMRSYTYTVRSRRWPARDPSEMVQELRLAMASRAGREAVHFYLTVIDQGTTEMLTQLAGLELALFLEVVGLPELTSPATRALSDEQTSRVVVGRLVQFAGCYSVCREHFPALKDRLLPYTDGEVGIWLHWPWYGLRGKTDRYPQPIVELPDELLAQMFGGRMSQRFVDELQPGGPISNVETTRIVNQLPQAVAWSVVNKQLADLVAKRLLNESNAPEILGERAWNLLLSRPMFGVAGTSRDALWAQMSFESPVHLRSTTIQHVRDAARRFADQCAARTHSAQERMERRYYEVRMQEWIELDYYLDLLSVHSEQLGPPPTPPEQLFSYLHQPSLTVAVDELRRLAPVIRASYRALLDTNFPTAAAGFAVYRQQQASLLIELSRVPQTDYLGASYIWLPSDDSGHLVVREVPWRESVAEATELPVRSAGNLFASKARIHTSFAGRLIVEQDAVISRTRFPSRTPVAEQVYQLIGNEAPTFFGRSLDWHGIDYPRGGRDESLLRVIAHHRRSHGAD